MTLFNGLILENGNAWKQFANFENYLSRRLWKNKETNQYEFYRIDQAYFNSLKLFSNNIEINFD